MFVICPQFRFDTDWVLCLLSREGKKARSPTGGRGSVQPRSHIQPASVSLPMTPDEKPVPSPGVPTWPRVQSCWYRERKGGERAPGHQGLDEQMVASPPGLQRMGEPSQVKRGMRVGERCARLGTTSPGINHWAEVGIYVEPASPCRGRQRGRMSWGITGGKQDGTEGDKEEDKRSW